MSERAYEEERLAELIMHVANRLLGHPRFGRVKLNKILFFADFTAHRRNGESITGAVYQNLPQGPGPQQLVPVVRALQGRGDVVWRNVPTVAGDLQQLVPLRPAALGLFSGTEIAIVEEVIDELRDLTAAAASDLSHETIAWRLTAEYDEIPYGAALLSHDPPTSDDLAWRDEVSRA